MAEPLRWLKGTLTGTCVGKPTRKRGGSGLARWYQLTLVEAVIADWEPVAGPPSAPPAEPAPFSQASLRDARLRSRTPGKADQELSLRELSVWNWKMRDQREAGGESRCTLSGTVYAQVVPGTLRPVVEGADRLSGWGCLAVLLALLVAFWLWWSCGPFTSGLWSAVVLSSWLSHRLRTRRRTPPGVGSQILQGVLAVAIILGGVGLVLGMADPARASTCGDSAALAVVLAVGGVVAASLLTVSWQLPWVWALWAIVVIQWCGRTGTDCARLWLQQAGAAVPGARPRQGSLQDELLRRVTGGVEAPGTGADDPPATGRAPAGAFGPRDADGGDLRGTHGGADQPGGAGPRTGTTDGGDRDAEGPGGGGEAGADGSGTGASGAAGSGKGAGDPGAGDPERGSGEASTGASGAGSAEGGGDDPGGPGSGGASLDERGRRRGGPAGSGAALLPTEGGPGGTGTGTGRGSDARSGAEDGPGPGGRATGRAPGRAPGALPSFSARPGDEFPLEAASEPRMSVEAALSDPSPFLDGSTRVTLASDLLFSFDEDQLRPEAEPRLRQVAKLLRVDPRVRVVLEGHADTIGGDQYNQGLSERRAQAVRSWLIERAHINPLQIDTVGFGSSRPLVPTSRGPAAQQANRRVEVRVISPAR